MSVTVSFVTCGSEEEARTIARALVEEKIVACVSIVPAVTSVYVWEGKLHMDPEHLLVIKSTEERSQEVVRRVQDLHSYDVPEIVTFPVASGNPAYLRWVEASVP